MVNNFIDSFSELFSYIKKQKRYITSKKTKDKINNLYRKHWLPIANDFKEKFEEENHNIIENSLFDLYQYGKSNTIKTKNVIELLKNIEPILDCIQIELIRKYGSVIEYDKKKQIIDKLTKYQFKGTLNYLKKSESNSNKGDWKECCSNARLGIEEFMREFREKIFKKTIPKGSLGDHINSLKNKINLKDSEIKLVQLGLYGFLSEKGSHATTDVPDSEDSIISIDIVYILTDYLIKKYHSYL